MLLRNCIIPSVLFQMASDIYCMSQPDATASCFVLWIITQSTEYSEYNITAYNSNNFVVVLPVDECPSKSFFATLLVVDHDGIYSSPHTPSRLLSSSPVGTNLERGTPESARYVLAFLYLRNVCVDWTVSNTIPLLQGHSASHGDSKGVGRLFGKQSWVHSRMDWDPQGLDREWRRTGKKMMDSSRPWNSQAPIFTSKGGGGVHRRLMKCCTSNSYMLESYTRHKQKAVTWKKCWLPKLHGSLSSGVRFRGLVLPHDWVDYDANDLVGWYVRRISSMYY